MGFNSRGELKINLHNYCCCYDSNCHSRTELHEDVMGHTIQHNVHLIIKDPPYNIVNDRICSFFGICFDTGKPYSYVSSAMKSS